MIKKLISSYDFDSRPEVLIWYEGIDHPTVGSLGPDNKWRFMTNGYDQLLFCPDFSPSFIIEPEKEPTHFWDLPKV
jgi:hypothetical protein